MTPYHDYFLPIFLIGCLIATLTSFLAGRASGCVAPLILFPLGVLSLWMAMFIGAELGYRAWQAMPDPPEAAFSDASAAGALVLGWLPSGIYCLIIFSTVRMARILWNRGRARQVESASKRITPAIETGNPYQGPSPD